MEWNCLHLIACHSKIIANNDHQPASHWQAFSAVHHSLALAHVAITLKTMLNHSQQHRAVWAQISKWNVNCARSVAHCTHTKTPRKYTIHKHTCTAQCTANTVHTPRRYTHTHYVLASVVARAADPMCVSLVYNCYQSCTERCQRRNIDEVQRIQRLWFVIEIFECAVSFT